MIGNFSARMLQALNTIRMSNPKEYEIVMDELDSEVRRIDEVSRTLKDDRLIGWNQGGTQALSGFTRQARIVRNTVLQINENAAESVRDRQNDLRHRAI